MSQWTSFGTHSEYRRDWVVRKQKCDHSHSLPFCQPHPVGPGCLGCPAEDNQTSVSLFAMHIRITPPIQVLKCFIYFQMCCCFDHKLQGKNTRRVTYSVSLVSCISGWSLRSLFTLQTTYRGLEYLSCAVGSCFCMIIQVCLSLFVSAFSQAAQEFLQVR